MSVNGTYSDNPAESDLDAVRFAIGDTCEEDWLLSDEEINALLAQKGSALQAAIYACRRVSAKFARLADKQNGDNSIKSSQKSKRYAELATELMEEDSLSGFSPYAGGISVADKKANELDTDSVQPSFTRTLHDVVMPITKSDC